MSRRHREHQHKPPQKVVENAPSQVAPAAEIAAELPAVPVSVPPNEKPIQEIASVATPEQIHWFRRLLRNEWYGGIAGFCSIVGIPLAMYLYYASLQKPCITYYVSPVRGVMFQKQADSGLAVSFKGLPIDSDVSITQIYIWNAGEKPVKPEDVRQPVMVKLNGDGKILDVKVRKATDESTGFKASPKPANELSFQTFGPAVETFNDFGVEWKILERGEGANVQVTYVGEKDAKFSVSGKVIGQGPIEQYVTVGMLVKNPSLSPVAAMTGIVVAGTFTLFGLFLIYSEIRKLAATDRRSKYQRWFTAGFGLGIAVYFGKMASEIWTIFRYAPPFNM